MKKILTYISLCLLLSSCSMELVTVSPEEGEARVTFLDIGQGDCEFIEFPDGTTVLIDCGEPDNGEKIIDYIEACGHDNIDFLVATHPHSDHIGSMQYVLENIDVDYFCMPKVEHTSKTYLNLIETVIDKEIEAVELKAGENLITGDGYSVDVIAPLSDSYEEMNNYSAVLKMDFKGCTFMFTGDAENVSEEEMLKSGVDLKSDILKIGHHGSSSSTTDKFLEAADPQYAVISCGEDNSYGHPHKEIIEKLEESDITYLRTDTDGNIAITTDGDSVKIYTNK